MNKIILFTMLFLSVLAVPMFSQPSAATTGPMSLLSRPSDFPTPPKTDNSLFFIQRNKNKNTIVYDANFKGGKFDTSTPIDAYWLRYGSNGARKELTWTQNTFAYGYSSKKNSSDNSFNITLTAYSNRKIHLHTDSKGKPIATMTINGKKCRLNYIWVYADDQSSWPKVYHVDLHGTELATGLAQKERIKN